MEDQNFLTKVSISVQHFVMSTGSKTVPGLPTQTARIQSTQPCVLLFYGR